jgi:hypothetical protein
MRRATSLVFTWPISGPASAIRRSTVSRSCCKTHEQRASSTEAAANLKAPRFLIKVCISVGFGDSLEVLLHLRAQGDVERAKVRKAGDSQVKVKDMVVWLGENLAKESCLSKRNSQLFVHQV